MQEFRMNLQMFAEGGGDGGAAGSAGAETGATAPVAAESTQPEPRARKRHYNPLENVQYGIQEQPAEPQAEAQQDESPEDFESLIKGKYKKDFDARVQTILDGRFKKANEDKARLDSQSEIINIIARKYNVDPTDTDQLYKTLSDDDSLYEDEAIERGMSVESLKAIKQMERENEKLKAQQEMSQQQMMIRQHLDELGRQATELQKLYPNFDLQAELQNPLFVRLTAPNSGVDVRTAFEVVHRDELRGAEMQYAAQKSAERMAASVRANKSRPAESAMNGTQTQNQVKTDPRSLTRADRAEIKRRVALGEKIRF